MCILQALEIEKSYGARVVLSFRSLHIYEGDKIGIVGANGAGKSTLLGILNGEMRPDKGTVAIHRQAAFIRQVTVKDSHLSGGEAAKERIAAETRENDAILFADEPTASLDQSGVRWVRQKLRAAKTVVLISHDRALLDEICNRIIEVKDGEITQYTGNFTDYRRQVEQRRAMQQQKHEEYMRKKQDLERALQLKRKKAKEAVKAPSRMGNSEARLGSLKGKIKQKKVQRQATVLEARLERLEKVEKVREAPKLAIDFALTQPPGNRNVIVVESLSFAYGDKVIFRNAAFVVPNRSKIAVTGDNGCGKTTLLRLVVEGCDGIRTAPKLRIGYLHQGFEDIDLEKTVLDNARTGSVQAPASVRGVLAGLLFRGNDVYKPAGVLSGGEKMRLALAKLVVSNANALFLDEPTNYLDLPSLEAVQRVLQAYPGTVLLVSHDRKFRDAVAGTQWSIADGNIIPLEQESPKRGAAEAGRMVLEMRLARIAGQITSAAPDEKVRLETEYARTLEELRAINQTS